MSWVTLTSETVTAANQRQLGIMTSDKPCPGLQPNNLLPVGWRYEKQEEVDAEGESTNNYRDVFVSPAGKTCVASGGEVDSGTYGTLILLGAAAAVLYLVWRK